MSETVASIGEREGRLTELIIGREFRSERADEFATHGLARRLKAISYSLLRVFEVLPPDLRVLPSSEQRAEATAHIQSVSFNVYGCFDNLARVWVYENDVRRPDGTDLGVHEIGFVAKCKRVRASLPQNLRQELAEMDDWFTHLENFRHATAHRIPLYIPPFMLDPRNQERYAELELQASAALRRHSFDEYNDVIAARNSLRFFRPMIATSVNENVNALFHPQLLADFATVELWVQRIFDHLAENG